MKTLYFLKQIARVRSISKNAIKKLTSGNYRRLSFNLPCMLSAESCKTANSNPCCSEQVHLNRRAFRRAEGATMALCL